VFAKRGTLTLRREDGRVISERVEVCDTLRRRLVGLLGRKSIGPDEGVVLRPSFSIHTAFMRFSIDVVFIDHDQTVVRIHPGLKPFSTASCRGAREVVELAAGECARRGLEVGDRVAWAARGRFEETPTKENALPAAPTTLGTVLVASSEQRFAKLARFLLAGRNAAVESPVSPADVVGALDESIDVVLLDIGDRTAEGLRTANAIRSTRPEIDVVLAGETEGEGAFSGVRVYDRWNETEELVDAIVQLLEDKRAGGTRSAGLIA
jgi:uncharacterized protein